MEKTAEKWRRWHDEWLKQERKNTTKPLRGLRPNIPSSIPGECEQCVSVCVCCGFEASIWRGWRAPSSPRPCRPQHLWAGGGRSPRRRSRRPARCCLKDEKDEFYCERFHTALFESSTNSTSHVWTEHLWSFPPHAGFVNLPLLQTAADVSAVISWNRR